ncbi:GNAT family N-acetyltransferase [Hymenobacter saemangeumensis]|uniref:GNAT family N-acetyltransferase n=1 Tax=Hymenobacter saemangeumensis TaxID=1084522 RepID=UPI0031EEEFE3
MDTISSVCRPDYTAKQLEVWTSGVNNEQRWRDILLNQFVLVALQDTEIVGFATLDAGHYIDLLYVHKDYQRQGIAQELYTEIEKEARQQQQVELTADVSITARVFFESVGFSVINEQVVMRQGVELINFRMRKFLHSR